METASAEQPRLPVNGMFYAQAREYIGLDVGACEEKCDHASSMLRSDDDFGQEAAFRKCDLPAVSRQPPSEADQSAFDRAVADAMSNTAPTVDSLRLRLITSAKRQQALDIRKRRLDPKRKATEDRLRKMAANQIRVNENMLHTVCEAE